MVGGNDRGRCACGGDLSGLEQDGAVAQALDRGRVVRDEKTGDAAVPELLDPLQALDLNSASPTASTSSTSRMSASRCAATANPSRTAIPDECHFTGVSMNCPTPAKSTIDSSFAAISRRPMPRIAPLRKTFSRPVSSDGNRTRPR